MTRLVRYLDIILGGAGFAGATVAVTLLFGWVIALLLASIALIVFALVAPAWD